MQTKNTAVNTSNINTAITVIVSDIGTPINMLYAQMKDLAGTLMFNKGNLQGFNMLVGGTSSRWVNNTYNRSLKSALHKLCAADKQNTTVLHSYLMQTASAKSYSNIRECVARGLKDYVKRANKTDAVKRLQQAVEHWEAVHDEYIGYLQKLQDEADDAKNEEALDKLARKEAKAERNALIGEHNVQAQQIIEAVLAQIPSKDAMAIRLALHRVAAEDKLKVVERELLERNIVMK